MNKDVIYIDTEDDITSVVGKIKASKQRIIALVPPKRVGILQSAVNIRLLARAAEVAEKRIVLVTNDEVLARLAATAEIPVAKNLQSKPELADVPVVEIDNNDVIDGGKLSVGELADAAKKDRAADAAIDRVIAEDSDKNDTGKASAASVKDRAKGKATPKVPDFNIFRKKFMLIGGALVLLIGFIVWATMFAPTATVIISAKTASETISETITLSSATDAKANTVKSTTKELTKEISVEFSATGEKNVGEKATGTISLSNLSDKSITISAGTTLVNTGSGLSYVLTSSVTVPRSYVCSGEICYGTADGTITAVEGGSKYNSASGPMKVGVADVSASLKSPTSGGTDKTATVVTSDDLEKAKTKLAEQQATGLKEELMASFGGSAKVISDSYSEKRSEPTSSVLVDAEATGNVKLKAQVTATMLAVDQADLQAYVEAKINESLAGKESQKIYDNGISQAAFAQYVATGDTRTVRLSVNATIGPEIDEAKVKEASKGRTYGEIQSSIEAISGVEDVDIKFSPFWVSSAPNNTDKIKVEFKLDNAN